MATLSIQTFLSNTFASGISGYSGAGGGGSGAGTSGFSGYSGFSGESGFSGISGYSGTGSSGFSGISGFSGAGTSGFSGVSGFSGAGTSGFSGFSGASTSGFSGYSGLGLSGYSGATGAPGTTSVLGGSTGSLLYQQVNGYSIYFDGSGDYLTINGGMNVDSSDFTIESWIYPTIWTGQFNSIFSTRATSNTAGSTDVWVLGIHSTGYPYIYSGAFQIVGSAGLISLNVWQHVAVSRQTNTMRMFVNGTLVQTETTTQNYTQVVGAIGGNRDGSEPWTGFISNLRLVKGTAVYTSSFTPSTTQLTAITNTQLLTAQSASIIDNSVNNFSLTVTGNTTVSTLNPFGTTATQFLSIGASGTVLTSNGTVPVWGAGGAGTSGFSGVSGFSGAGDSGFSGYSGATGAPGTTSVLGGSTGSLLYQQVNGYSIYFDGSGDFLSVPGNFAFGTGNWTVEFWVYPVAYGGTTAGGQLFGTVNGSTIGYSINLGESINTFRIISNASGTWADNLTAGTGNGPALNIWTHMAVVRNNANLTIYRNGLQVATTSGAAALNFSGTTAVIGRFNEGVNTRDFNGYLSNLRVVNGTAVYTGNFTPSTTQLTAITNTQLLTAQSPTIIDNSTNNLAIVVNGNATASVLTPFGTTGTQFLAIGGSGTYLSSDGTVPVWSAGGGGGSGYSGFSGISGFSGAGVSGFSGFSGASTSGFSGFSGAAGGGSGTQGNIAGLTYQFSTNTAMTDPDQGYVRFNNATAGSVTEIAIDNLTYQGTSVGSYLDTWDDSTSTPKGTLIIKTNSNTDNTYSIFNLSSVTDNAGPATYSISINGDNSNYISAPVSSAFTFGTADFTIEGWIYSNVNNSGRGVFQQATSLFPSSTSNSVALGTNSNATWQLYAKNTNTNSVATFATNTWYHFAVVRSGTTTNLYINGISIITLTNDTTNYTGTYMGIGSIYQSVTYNWNGYISNFRVVKGTAVYTTNFTPPAAPLTAITNTQLLTGQNVTIIDNSANNFTLTVAGTVTTTTVNPFGAGTGFKTLGVTYVAGSIPINNQIIALQFYATGNSGFSGGAGGGGGASGFSGFSGESGAGTSGYSGISGYSGTGSLQISIVSGTTQTANSNTQYVLTNVGTTTVTLPGSPANGDIVWITVANNLNTNVIARNGNQIMGLSEDMTIDVANVTVRLRYIDSTYMWRLI